MLSKLLASNSMETRKLCVTNQDARKTRVKKSS